MKDPATGEAGPVCDDDWDWNDVTAPCFRVQSLALDASAETGGRCY